MLFVNIMYTYQQTMQIVHHTLIISKNYFAYQKKKV